MILPMAWIGFCIATGLFAHVRRNRNGIAWFFISLVLSPLVGFVLLLILLPLEPVLVQQPYEHYEQRFAIAKNDMTSSALSVALVLLFIAIVALVALLAKTASAQQQVIRDASGHVVVTSTQSGNMTTYRDSFGNTIGTGTIDSSGTTVFRDSRGRATGSITDYGRNATGRR